MVALVVWEWRAIPGWEGFYEVSDCGQVRSVDRLTMRNGFPARAPGQVLKLRGAGYLRVDLSRPGERKTRKVHALVALAFIGPRPEGMQVAHYDGEKFNNAVENLRYATPSENEWDKVRQGRHAMANRTHCIRGGHPFSPENIYWQGRKRRCVTCNRERGRLYRESLKKKAAA